MRIDIGIGDRLYPFRSFESAIEFLEQMKTNMKELFGGNINE